MLIYFDPFRRKRVLLPFERKGLFVLMQGSHSVILKTTFGVKIIWDGDSYLEVIVPPAFKNKMCGLCGKIHCVCLLFQ